MATVVETRVPKDISKYKSKVAGPLTLRGVITVAIAVAIDGIGYLVLHKTVSTRYLIYIFIFLDIIPIMFNAEPYGMPFEKYLKNVIYRNFLYPRYRREKNRMFIMQKPLSTDDKKYKKELEKRFKKEPDMKPIE